MPVNRLVFVTGLSGAGKSQAMKSLEDLGFYCVDNLPPKLVRQTLELLREAEIGEIAIALDVRSGGPLGDAASLLESSAGSEVLFFEARDDVLLRRYSETRRRHPFSGAGSLREAIAVERNAVAPLRALATHVIDTTSLTHADLKERLAASFDRQESQQRRLATTIVAFGFKYGIPLDLDLLFDVRFLHNPNYVDALRPLTGADRAVAEYIETDPGTTPFLNKIFDLMDFLLPRFITEGKSQLTIGVGCTGGRHRSIYVARRLYGHLDAQGVSDLHLDARDGSRR